jgi:hypothetical protein
LTVLLLAKTMLDEAPPDIEIVKDGDGPNWRAFIRRSDGPSEMKIGFAQEAEAREWAESRMRRVRSPT